MTPSVSPTSSSAPLVLTGTKLSVGYGFSCVITAEGAVKCWGLNTNGQLGNNRTTSSPVPVFAIGLTSGVTALCTSNAHSCAVHNGAAKCWGNNAAGQLGRGSDTSLVSTRIPKEVVGLTSGVLDITCGAGFTCALLVNKTAMCWGQSGYLGINSSAMRDTPAAVVGLVNIDRIFTSQSSTCAAVNSSTETYCWGNRGSGQLGTGSNTSGFELVPVKMSPVDFAGTGTLVSFGGGNNFNCGVNSTGWANCVGSNSDGVLGDETTAIERISPVAVIGLGNKVKQMGMSWRIGGNCAVLTTGEAKCWGDFGTCCIGNGTSTSVGSLTPVSVVGPNDYEYVGVGNGHTCVIRGSNKEIWCWGLRSQGRLGDNSSFGTSATPKPVLLGETL